MSKLCFRLCNQAGVQACIERDGVWIKIGKNTKRFDLKTNLEEKWFKNPKAYLSISGSFMYLISDGELNLLTLTCDKNNMVYADELEKGTKFIDANFSYEETLLYALTDSNKIYVFSLLPPKKIQELFFDWDHIATSFKTLFFSPDDGFDSTIAFSIESDSGAKVTQDFCIPKEHQYLRPNQRLVLEPIEERKSLFPSFDELLHEQDSHIVSSNDEDDETESPTTIEEAVKALQKKREKLRKYENKIKKRTKKLESKIDFINSKNDAYLFGFSYDRRFENQQTKLGGPFYYHPPEKISEDQIIPVEEYKDDKDCFERNQLADIYSFGVLMHEIITDVEVHTRFKNAIRKDVFKSLKESFFVDLMNESKCFQEDGYLIDQRGNCIVGLKEIIEKCMKVSPDERYSSFHEIINSIKSRF